MIIIHIKSNSQFSSLSKEYEQQNRQQKDFRNRIESVFEWIKQTQRYEPLSDKRDLESLQREHTRLNEKHQQITDKSKEIDTLLRNINKFEQSKLSLLINSPSSLSVQNYPVILYKNYVKKSII